jgi:hypothetical protein
MKMGYQSEAQLESQLIDDYQLMRQVSKMIMKDLGDILFKVFFKVCDRLSNYSYIL